METPAENKHRANETRANKKGRSFLIIFYFCFTLPLGSLVRAFFSKTSRVPGPPPSSLPPISTGIQAPSMAVPAVPRDHHGRAPPPARPFLPCRALPAHSLRYTSAPPGWVPFPTGMVPLGNVLVKKKKTKKKEKIWMRNSDGATGP